MNKDSFQNSFMRVIGLNILLLFAFTSAALAQTSEVEIAESYANSGECELLLIETMGGTLVLAILIAAGCEWAEVLQ